MTDTLDKGQLTLGDSFKTARDKFEFEKFKQLRDMCAYFNHAGIHFTQDEAAEIKRLIARSLLVLDAITILDKDYKRDL